MNFQLFNIKLANKVLFQWIILILFYAKICKKIYIYKIEWKIKMKESLLYYTSVIEGLKCNVEK